MVLGDDNGEHDAGWRQLLDKFDMVDAATAIAWNALVDAYKSNASGEIAPAEGLLRTYRRAKALRAAAERELVLYILTHRR